MGKARRKRTKHCHRCARAGDVLFRVRIEDHGDWVFVCPSCLHDVKPGNPHYQYGGTWKRTKRR